jgi:hypothetical protein
MQPTTDRSSDLFAPRALLGALALLLAACGGTASGTGGVVLGDGGLPPDAGLKPGANIEDCRTPEGLRLCGTKVQCYAYGPECACWGGAADPLHNEPGMDRTNPELGICEGADALIPEQRNCGWCLDGEVCAWGAFGMRTHLCVPEAVARVAWKNGYGALFSYADGSPYDGTPIPSAAVCPPPDGDLELCGGDCGGCSKPGFYCSGRSPTHPLGLCTSDERLDCLNVPGGQLLVMGKQPGWRGNQPDVCVRDCPRLAATVPGGAECIDPY